MLVQANFAESGPNLEVQPIKLISSESCSIAYRKSPIKSLRLKLFQDMV